MANDSIPLYNFYKRYLWLAQDFDGWQEGMVSLGRGQFEGCFGAAILQGYDVATLPTGGMSIDVNAGIACGPTGYLHVVNTVTTLGVSAPASGGMPAKALVVASPDLEDDTNITRPTDPFDIVPLRSLQKTVLSVIQGTPANQPVYPAKGVNDVVLFGINLTPGMTQISQSDLDLEVRDVPGKNSDFHQHNAKYDDRCRVFGIDRKTVGVKPSQTFGAQPKCFTYVAKGTPSKFPMDSINFEFNPADTVIDLELGTITGGDQVTPDFTPVVPTAGNAIVVAIGLGTDNQLDIAYGTQGTVAQCYNAIINQVQSPSPGGVLLNQNKLRLSFIIVKSNDGATISDLEMFDGRSTFYFGGPDPQAFIIQNASQSNVSVPINTTMFNPFFDIKPGHTIEVQAGAALVSIDLLTIEPGGTLQADAGSTVRVL